MSIIRNSRLNPGYIDIEFPPVEIEEFLVAAAEEQIKVVDAAHLAGDISVEDSIFGPDFDLRHRPSANVIDIKLDYARILTVKHLNRSKLRLTVAKIDIAQFNPVAIVD